MHVKASRLLVWDRLATVPCGKEVRYSSFLRSFLLSFPLRAANLLHWAIVVYNMVPVLKLPHPPCLRASDHGRAVESYGVRVRCSASCPHQKKTGICSGSFHRTREGLEHSPNHGSLAHVSRDVPRVIILLFHSATIPSSRRNKPWNPREMAEPKFQEWTVREPYLDVHCKLGEGPYYEEATDSLRFVDIINRRVHSVSLQQGPASLQTIQLDVPVTVTADIEGCNPKDKILIGVKYGVAVLDRSTGRYEYVARFAAEDNTRTRSNDGAVDPHGRFWLGSMTDFGLGPFQPEGKQRT